MLNWIKQFNIFCFLDNHQYRAAAGNFECLAGVKARHILQKNGAQPVLPYLDNFIENDWVFGHFGYELCAETENIRTSHPDPLGFAQLFLFIPEVVVQLSASHCIIETVEEDPEQIWKEINNYPVDAGENMQKGLSVSQRFSRQEYIDCIERLREHILRGDCYEINFCQEFYIKDVKIDPLRLYKNLTEESPNPFSVFYRNEARYLACASPERYLRKKDRQIWSQPIKGTTPRALSQPALDEERRQYLLSSKKEKAENVMVVDIVRNDLSRVCKRGSVQVEELFGIYSFPQVHQMISTITGELREGVTLSQILMASFPMASMTGAPKKRVMELIEMYERSRRGLFSGAVGYVAPNGDFDFNVVIRSIFYNADQAYLSFQTGSGITYYSDPVSEWEECLLKAEAIKKVLAHGQH